MSGAAWHAAAIDGFVDRARTDPDARGVVLVGSAARGTAKATSDVDVYLVVDDAAFDRAAGNGRIAYVDRTGIDDRHGYVDVKLTSPAYLREAAAAGDDPLRASFVGFRVLWDAGETIGILVDTLLDPAPGYFETLETAFAAQVALHGGYFLRQALQNQNRLLTQHAALHAAYAAGRLVLAHDRVFFRGAKYLEEQLTSSPSTPAGLGELLNELADRPSDEGMRRVECALLPLVPHGFAITDEVLSRFITDNELGWRTGISPPEFR